MNETSAPLAEINNSLVWQLVAKLDEQRCYPRVPVDIRAAVRTDTGAKMSALIVNISPDGMQARCSVEAARLLRPANGKIDPVDAPRVNVALALPVGSGCKTLVARCRLAYLTTVDSEPRCVVGLRFGRLDKQSERIINEFFADQFGLD